MKYKYKLKQDSYYTSNGCDCCEADLNELWYITRVYEDGTEAVVRTNGTVRYLGGCYEAILIDAGIDLEIEWEDGN